MLHRQKGMSDLGALRSSLAEPGETVLVVRGRIPVSVAAGRKPPRLNVECREVLLEFPSGDVQADFAIEELAEENHAAGGHRHAQPEIRIERACRITESDEPRRPVRGAIVVPQSIAGDPVVLDWRERLCPLERCS